MKLSKILFLFNLSCLIGLASCDNTKQSGVQVASISESSTKSSTSQIKNNSADSLSLTRFVKDVYKWKERKSALQDFYPLSDKEDSLYIGIDWQEQEKRQKELEATNYFSKEFLDNYSNISRTIDQRVKDGTYTWLVSELPPFGNDANPWCNCQDYPEEYWNTMSVSNILKSGNEVSFQWTFDGKLFYKAIATKIDNSWKIKYLQGFDFKEYLQ